MSLRRIHLFLALILCATASQTLRAEDDAPAKAPIQIEAQETFKEGNLAIARGAVVIGMGDTTIYCDYAQCDLSTHDVLMSGDVRIFRGEKVFSGDRAVYNLDSKRITGSEFRTAAGPFLAKAHSLVSISSDSFEASGGLFTTDNTSDPGFHIKARKVRIYRNDHTEYENVTVYVGRTPVLWLPYLYQPGKTDQSFTISPGSNSTWGPFLLTRFAFPVSNNTYGGARLDYMGKRGVGLGMDLTMQNRGDGSWGRFRSYYVNDKNPGTKDLGSSVNDQISPSRFRVSLQDRSFLSDTVYTSINFNKVSDINFYKDFSPFEMQRDPNPDSVFAVTKWSENFTLNLSLHKQFNKDFEGDESLPALALDVKRQPFLDSGIFYEGETSAAKNRKYWSLNTNSVNPAAAQTKYFAYQTERFDTFHQWTYPKVLGGWLSVVPRVGIRGTHYSASTMAGRNPMPDPDSSGFASGGALDRVVFNAGLEGSFKLSKIYDSVENRTWGLDGVRHILQPFVNYSWVSTSQDPLRILPIDASNPSSKLSAIDFPQFNGIDSISNWNIVRLGMRNRLQTRRDQQTLNWLEVESFLDVRMKEAQMTRVAFDGQNIAKYSRVTPADDGTYSNLFNRLAWSPLPWFSLNVDSQVPVIDGGFTELNTTSNIQATRDLTFSLGNRFVHGNAFFNDSNLLTNGIRYRVSDNWAVSVEHFYEVETRQMEYQRYSIDRDLRSWMASLSVVVRERTPKNEMALLLTLILKDVPKFRLPLHVDPEAVGGSGSSKNP